MSDLPETKRCPYLVAALIPLLGKLSDDVADAGMSCLQDKCAMWRLPSPGFCGLAGNPMANYPQILYGENSSTGKP